MRSLFGAPLEEPSDELNQKFIELIVTKFWLASLTKLTYTGLTLDSLTTHRGTARYQKQGRLIKGEIF